MPARRAARLPLDADINDYHTYKDDIKARLWVLIRLNAVAPKHFAT
ncbi:hypothetical protein [Cryptobacterium curtum]|nr:hypothetical protein [Cryptobacterium curtum]